MILMITHKGLGVVSEVESNAIYVLLDTEDSN